MATAIRSANSRADGLQLMEGVVAQGILHAVPAGNGRQVVESVVGKNSRPERRLKRYSFFHIFCQRGFVK